jgi:ATP-dependent RNA helicase DeaD
MEIAAALAKMARGDTPLLLEKQNANRVLNVNHANHAPVEERGERMDRGDRNSRQREAMQRAPEPGMQTYRLAVGHRHGVAGQYRRRDCE